MTGSSSSIRAWLEGLRLGAYAEVLVANRVDFDSLPSLTEVDLRELGIPLGPRKLLLSAIAGLSAAPQRRGEGERRQLTVMFCDLVGATQLSSQLDPEDLRDVLGDYQAVCAQIIRSHGGYIAQYLGDGILVYFGFPLAIESAAERAVAAGLDIVKAVPEVSPRCAGEIDTRLQVRVGIATGVAVVGDIIGEGASEQSAVIGQVPNLAARIQSLAAPGTVAIARSTRLLLGDLFSLAEMGTHALKGIPGRVQVWEVLAHNAPQSRYASLRGLGGGIIGRHTECAHLNELWSKARAGAGQVAIVVGDAGIGKSTLLHHLGARAEGDACLRISWQCSDLHVSTPLYPLIVHLHRAADLRPGDDPAQKLAKIEAMADPAARDSEVPLLAALLSVPLAAPYKALAVMPQQRKAMTLKFIVNQVVRLSETTPVLVTVEDVHWIDPTTGELAAALFERITESRVMVLITARPEFTAPWRTPPNHTRIDLDRLGGTEARALIGSIAGGQALPEVLTQMIESRSDGVPLFIEELTKTVLESDQASSETIPGTLRDILGARFDRIGEAKYLAQAGAAIGRRFTLAMLSAVTGRAEDALRTALGGLVRAGLITSRVTDGNEEYIFRHSLIQETAYNSMLRARSKHLHAAVAEALEKKFAALAADEPTTVAHHCARAEQFAKAAHYLCLAGKRALAQYANVEAARHAERGAEMLAKSKDAPGLLSFELSLLLGQASYVTNGPAAQATIEAYTQAQDLVSHVADSDQRCALLYGIFSSYHFAARFDLALGPAERIMELAETEDSDWFRCQAHRMFGYIHFFTGACAEADAHFSALARHYRPAAFGPLAPRFGADCLVGARGFHALILCLGGEPECAARMSVENLSYALELGHPATTGWAYAAACYLAFFTGDRAGAKAVAAEGVRYCREHKIAAWLVHCRVFDVWAHFEKGFGGEMINEIRALVGEAAKSTLLGIPMLRGVIVELLLALGHQGDALGECEQALAELRTTRQHFFEPTLLALRTKCIRTCAPRNEAAIREAALAATDCALRLDMPYVLRAAVRN
jgi:class 3 adenylate cyclase